MIPNLSDEYYIGKEMILLIDALSSYSRNIMIELHRHNGKVGFCTEVNNSI